MSLVCFVLTGCTGIFFHSAHLLRQASAQPEKYRVQIQKSDCAAQLSYILNHSFNATSLEKAQSPEVYLGSFQNCDEINIVFRNETDDADFVEDVTIPVICLRSNNIQPELTLTGEGVELKIVFLLSVAQMQVVHEKEHVEATKLSLSASAYRTIRASVIAIANIRQYITDAADSIIGTVQYTLDGSKFVLSVSCDLSRDFLVSLDMLFGESCQLLDLHIDGARELLLASLCSLAEYLQHRVERADAAVAQRIRLVLQKLAPHIHRLARIAYPFVSVALYFGQPVCNTFYPLFRPVVNRALAVHEGLQQSSLVGPFVTTVTSRVQVAYKEAVDIYVAIGEKAVA